MDAQNQTNKIYFNPSQISIALSAIALVLLQALLISALSSTPSYAAESQHMTKKQIKKRVDSFCKDPSTSLFKDTDTTKDIKRLNYALVKRCFKKLANKRIDCPSASEHNKYIAYNTAYTDAQGHWAKRFNDTNANVIWLIDMQEELKGYNNKFRARCGDYITAAKAVNSICNSHFLGTKDCEKNAAELANWCVQNKTSIQACKSKTTFNECLSGEEDRGLHAYLGAKQACKSIDVDSTNKTSCTSITPMIFATDLRLDYKALNYLYNYQQTTSEATKTSKVEKSDAGNNAAPVLILQRKSNNGTTGKYQYTVCSVDSFKKRSW